MAQSRKGMPIHWQIMIGILLGIGFGFYLNQTGLSSWAAFVEPLGQLFLKLLKMIIMPLVAASVFLAVAEIGSIEKLGKLGGRTFLYYVGTTLVAACLGLFLVNLIQPGVGVDLAMSQTPDFVLSSGATQKGFWEGMLYIFLSMVPSNPFAAFSEGKVLQIIVFMLFLGVLVSFVGQSAKPIVSFARGINDLMFKATDIIMKIAPIGVFGLLVGVVAHLGLDPLLNLGKYMLTVLLGLAIHGMITLPILLYVFGKRNPLEFAKDMMPALSTAFSISSSAATLPITMECVIDRAKIKKEAAEFILPLGATVNMDGTALLEAVAAVFIAQAYGIDLSLGAQVVVIVTATLASIGAAAIPSAGFITLAIVLSALGLPLEGLGLLLAVDRVLDMCRTAVNVWGDSVGTAIVSRYVKL
jgi:proton glutamate symport protein